MKKQQLVQIPVGHVCIPCAELFDVKSDNFSLFAKNVELRSQIKGFKERITALEVDLVASEAKIADLEKELSEKKDRVLYWYDEHNKLQEKLNALASNASQANAVKPDAKTEEA